MKNLLFWIGLAVLGALHLQASAASPPAAPSANRPLTAVGEEEAGVDNVAGIRPDGYELVTVLIYHDFKEVSQTPLQIARKEFEEQMKYLKENGYHVISLEDFYDFIDLKRKLPEKAVVITIDDGWKATYTIAYPILKKYGFPATIFVYTDFISPHNPGALTWDLLKEMHREGLDVQAHSKTHQLRIPWKKEGETEEEFQKRIEKELAFPKEVIQKNLGNKVQYIAYPFGQFSDDFVRAAKKYGYRGGLTVTGATVKEGAIVKRRANPFFIDPFEVRRVQVLGGANLADFVKKLKPYEEYKVYDGQYDHLFNLPSDK